MDATRHDSPEFVGFGIDASHSEPASDPVGATVDTLARDPCIDVQDVDTDFDEPFGENISEITLTEIVVL